VPSGIYNLGSGVAISNLEVVKIVERVLGRKVNVVFRSARPFDVDGICIVTVPFFYMLHEEPYDFWRPTDHALRHFAASRGLEVLESRRNGDGWDVLGTLLCSTSVCRRRKGFVAYIVLAPVWLGHKLLKWFFKSRMLQDVIEFQMRYYTGNFFLLGKK
jgi:hypothetical protein